MKIGILTQPLVNNYGGLLQNYALQTLLKREGHIVCTLDWSWVLNNTFKSKIIKLLFYFRGVKTKDVYIPTLEEDLVIHKNVYHFRDTYINHTSKFTSVQDFSNYDLEQKPDAYIVGSDQCWRPKYNPFQGAMFLNFVYRHDIKRVAYAASFGTDEWEFKGNQYALLTKKFDLVTVREQSGIKLCKDYLGVEAHHVLDPTLLLDKEDYVDLIKAEEHTPSRGNLFYYILDPNPEIDEVIKHIGLKLNLVPFMVLPKFKEEYRLKEHIKNHISDCVYPSPTKWLQGIMDAEMTIVDSFHGMVFSIIFNKPFWVIGNAARGMSRFLSLLKLFGLEHRLVTIQELGKVNLFEKIDWTSVNAIKEQKKQESISLLLNALKK